jgi:predicted O-methyltransferase YrrM
MPYPGFDRDTDARIERQEYLYHRSQKQVRGLDVALIRKTSIEAVQQFEDESLDFIYIDGNHKLQYAVQDIMEWYPKIRKGGVMSGHDYINPDRAAGVKDTIQVKYAVDVCVRALKVRSFYVLGEMHPKKGEKRDKYRSWMWIK